MFIWLTTFLQFAYLQFIKYQCMVILGTNRISKRSSSADPPRRCTFLVLPLFFESPPFLILYFPVLSYQLILSPSLLLSSISFITKAHIHSSTKSLNCLSCLSISFSLHHCKFMGMLLITMKYIDSILHDYFYSVVILSIMD